MADDSTHRQFEQMAVGHVLGGLDVAEGRVFRSHLLECASCRARVGELRAIASDLAGVERDERRQRSAKVVETKSREGEAEEPIGREPRQALGGRWLFLALITLLVGLSAYTFVLRGNLNRTEQALELRLEASQVLELGEDVPLDFRAPGVSGKVKVHGERVAVLAEGLDADTTYGVYLVQDDGERVTTVARHPIDATDGDVFVMLQWQGTEDRLLITEASGGFDPEGQLVLEAALPRTSVSQEAVD